MHTLDVSKKNTGLIWSVNKKPEPSFENGLIVTILHTVASSVSIPGRVIHFTHAAFAENSKKFVLLDKQGNVYIFDLDLNRFTLVLRIGTICTSVAYNDGGKADIILALPDCSVKCYNAGSKSLVNWLKGHESTIFNISINSNRQYMASASSYTGIIWNLNTFTRIHSVNLKKDVPILKVFFLPITNIIITCFKDDSIFAWDGDQLNLKYHLKSSFESAAQFKDFATSRDESVMIAGGKSNFLHHWILSSQLLKIIQLPNQIKSIKQLKFILERETYQIVGVLNDEGILYIINLVTGENLVHIGCIENKVIKFINDSSGCDIVAVMDSGNANIHSMSNLLDNLKKRYESVLQPVKFSERVISETSPVKRVKRSQTESSLNAIRKSTDSKPLHYKELEVDKLKNLLLFLGAYPDKYRLLIWQNLLHLPNNYNAFFNLRNKGVFPAYTKLPDQFPIKSPLLIQQTQRLLSALAYWSPVFADVSYLPTFVLPFVKFIKNNTFIQFEVVTTIIYNWCKYWFTNFPQPPSDIFTVIEDILNYCDKKLIEHYNHHHINPQVYAWPLMISAFSEVFSQKEWLIIWDNILTNAPSYLLIVVIAFNIVNRAAILSCQSKENFQQFFHQQSPSTVRHLIKKADFLYSSLPSGVHPNKIIDSFIPLSSELYPVFSQVSISSEDQDNRECQEDIRQEKIHKDLLPNNNVKQNPEFQIKSIGSKDHLSIFEENMEKTLNNQLRLRTLMQDIRLLELEWLKVKKKVVKLNERYSEQFLQDEIHKKNADFNCEIEKALLDAKKQNLELLAFCQQLNLNSKILQENKKSQIHVQLMKDHQMERKFSEMVFLNSENQSMLNQIKNLIGKDHTEIATGQKQKNSYPVYPVFNPAQKSLYTLGSILDNPLESLPYEFLGAVRNLRRKIVTEVLADYNN